MESQIIFNPDNMNANLYNKGISLIEVVVVIGILSVILSLGLVMSLDSYRGYLFRSERTILVSILSKARSQAMGNFFQSPHGVCFDDLTKSYIHFKGTHFVLGDPKNELTPSNDAISISAVPSFSCAVNGGVVFSQIAGTTTPTQIVMNEDANVAIISINYEGTISW